jgi:hypothetical protein
MRLPQRLARQQSRDTAWRKNPLWRQLVHKLEVSYDRPYAR